MEDDLIPIGGNPLLLMLRGMINSDEKIKKINHRTKVTTDSAEYSAWGEFKKNRIALFANKKPLK